MTPLDSLKAAGLIFVAAIIQVSLFSSVHVAGGMPNVLLVTLVAVALLRGSVFGAAGGFFGGLLLDTANLETLGLTSLILTVGGYWIGRYGETTGRDRTHAPYVSVAVVDRSLCGRRPGAALPDRRPGLRAAGAASTRSSRRSRSTSILTAPVYWIVAKLLPPLDWRERAGEVRLLG